MDDIYLRPTGFIDSDSSAVREAALRLTAGVHDPGGMAVRLFYFVRDRIHYNAYMISTHPEDFKASTVLERRQGYCVQKAVVLAALARAVGVPARLVFARIRNHRIPDHMKREIGSDILPSHGYNQLHIGGSWINVTPAFDGPLCQSAGIPAVEFDGVHDAILAPLDLADNPFVEYIEKYEPESDLPFEWVREKVSRVWGDKRSWLSEADSEGHTMPSGFRFGTRQPS